MIKASPGWMAYFTDVNGRIHQYEVEAWAGEDANLEECGYAIVVDHKTGRLTHIYDIANMYDLTFKLVAQNKGEPASGEVVVL